MLEGGSTIDVVQFLGFVDDCFDAGTFEKGDFAYDMFEGLLLRSEIVMSHVSYSLKAVGKGDVIIWVIFFGEPLEYLLIFVVFGSQIDLDLD